MTGYVYCIGDRGGMVKIGYSTDPAKRLAKIQSDTAAALAFVGAIPGTVQTEAQMHRRFADRRARGEWPMFNQTHSVPSGPLPGLNPRSPAGQTAFGAAPARLERVRCSPGAFYSDVRRCVCGDWHITDICPSCERERQDA